MATGLLSGSKRNASFGGRVSPASFTGQRMCLCVACGNFRLECMSDLRTHPVQSFAPDLRAAACPVALHGDEGQGKRDRSLMVLSWSVLGARGKHVLLYKFPFAVIRSVNMAFDSDGNNLTLQAMQREIARDLAICAKPETSPLHPKTLQYTLGRGDWKFKTHWLGEQRDYQNLKEKSLDVGFCRRCLCTSDCNNKHWLDVRGQSWNDPATVPITLDQNISPSLPCLGFLFANAPTSMNFAWPEVSC